MLKMPEAVELRQTDFGFCQFLGVTALSISKARDC